MSRVVFEIQGDPSPLCFICPNPVTLDSITKNFPLPGQWHFRARVPPPVAVTAVGYYVWEDVVNVGKVPVFEGRIHLKAFPLNVPGTNDFAASDDLIEVKAPNFTEQSDGDDSDGDAYPSRRDEPARRDSQRQSSAEASSLKEATASISLFGKAFASSAKAAMDAVRKNVAT